MYHYGTRSLKNLNECHPDLRVIFNKVIEYIDCSITEGERGKEEQNRLFHAGKSKLEYPNSNHNVTKDRPFPMAVDVAPYINGGIPWDDLDYFYYFGGIVLGIAYMLYQEGKITHQLRGGLDWDRDHELKDQSFHDLPHFELIGARPWNL